MDLGAFRGPILLESGLGAALGPTILRVGPRPNFCLKSDFKLGGRLTEYSGPEIGERWLDTSAQNMATPQLAPLPPLRPLARSPSLAAWMDEEKEEEGANVRQRRSESCHDSLRASHHQVHSGLGG